MAVRSPIIIQQKSPPVLIPARIPAVQPPTLCPPMPPKVCEQEARKCIECKVKQPINNFEAIGTRRRRVCRNCYKTTTTTKNRHAEVLTEKMEQIVVKSTDMTDTITNLNNYIQTFTQNFNDELNRRRNQEAEYQHTLQVVHDLVNAIPRQMNELIDPMNTKIDQITTVLQQNKEDLDNLLNITNDNFNDMATTINELIKTLPTNEHVLKLDQLMKDQNENIDTIREEVQNGNNILVQNHANLANDLEQIKQQIQQVNIITPETLYVRSPMSPRTPTTPTTGETTPTKDRKSRYSEGIVAIDMIRILSRDELDEDIKKVARLSTHYKGKPDKVDIYNIIRINLENLRREFKTRPVKK